MGRWRSWPGRGSLVALVLVVPALAAGCSIRALPEPPSTTAASVAAPTTTVGTVRGTTVATRAFLLDRDAPGSPVRAAPAGPLPVAFRQRTQELGDDRLVNLVLVSLASDRPATRIGDESLIDNRPRGTGTLTTDRAWMHFDITGLYRTWARGGPVPSQGQGIEPGTPLVDVRPQVMAEPYFDARFAGLGSDRRSAPHLRWSVTRGC